MLVTSDFNRLRFYNPGVMQNQNSSDSKPPKSADEEITVARLKRTLSQCSYVFIGACIFYFGLKKNLHVNEIINNEIKKNQINKLKKPIIDILS